MLRRVLLAPMGPLPSCLVALEDLVVQDPDSWSKRDAVLLEFHFTPEITASTAWLAEGDSCSGVTTTLQEYRCSLTLTVALVS